MKIVPAVGYITMAADSLQKQDAAFVASEARELNNLGETARQQVRDQFPDDDFRAGYLLGLETARVYLAGMAAAVIHKVSI